MHNAKRESLADFLRGGAWASLPSSPVELVEPIEIKIHLQSLETVLEANS